MTIAPPRRANPTVPRSGDNPRTVLGRLAAFVLRHRRIVIVVWLVLLLTGGMAAGQVSKRLSFDFSLPGQPGYETAARIIHTYGNGGDQPPDDPGGDRSGGRERDRERVPSISGPSTRSATPSRRLRVVDYGVTGNRRFVTNDGRGTYALVFTPPVNGFGSGQAGYGGSRRPRQQLPGYKVGLTGLNQLATGGDTKGPGSARRDDLRRRRRARSCSHSSSPRSSPSCRCWWPPCRSSRHSSWFSGSPT